MTDALGGTVSFGYDEVGNQVSITDPNLATRSFEHNPAGDVVAETDALDQVTTHGYDLAGRRVETIDPAGVSRGFGYDPAGRLVAETWPSVEITYGYSPEGWRNQMVDPTGTTTWTHDPMGRPETVTSPAGTIGYGYDPAGQLTSMDTPSGEVSYSWDPTGRLEALSDHLGTTTYTWTPGGRQDQISRPNGVDTTHDYDPAGRLVGIDHIGPEGTIATFDYTLDAAGNRIGVDTTDGTETYVLDELNRITEATYADGTTESFAYDPAGNRTSHTSPAGTTTYTYDLAGQLVSSAGPDADLTYSHDPVGRLTAISDGTTYTYNTAGQLTQATIAGTTHTYTYEADGIRVHADGQPQLWDRNGSLPMLVHDGDTHTWGPDANLLSTGDEFALVDALGSVRAHTDTTGGLTATVDYQAFGTPTTSSWDSFGYTAGIHDPTGLIHLRARQHHPGLGRFTTRDPIQPGAPGTGGYNHYTYVANNPTTWTDPTGQAVVIEHKTLRVIAAEATLLMLVVQWNLPEMCLLRGDCKDDEWDDIPWEDLITDPEDGQGSRQATAECPVDRAEYYAMVQRAPQTNEGPEYDYERRVVFPHGPQALLFGVTTGIGSEVNADGLDMSVDRALDAKWTEEASRSFFREDLGFMHGRLNNEFDRYRAVITDPCVPVQELVVRVNDEGIRAFFLAKTVGIPGRVEVVPRVSSTP